MSGYPQSADYALNKIDLLKCEVDHLRTVNAELLRVLEAVRADINDEHSEAWLTPSVSRQVRAAVTPAKSGRAA